MILLYAALLVGASLASNERVLQAGTPKYFCGFYLDCHVSVVLEDVEIASTIGPDSERSRASGVWYVVAVRYASDAIRARLTPGRPTATIHDARGEAFPRSLAGEHYVTWFVFDVPPDVENPVLHVVSGAWVDRLVELVLIGDDDSLLHARTVFRLPQPLHGPAVTS